MLLGRGGLRVRILILVSLFSTASCSFSPLVFDEVLQVNAVSSTLQTLAKLSFLVKNLDQDKLKTVSDELLNLVGNIYILKHQKQNVLCEIGRAHV